MSDSAVISPLFPPPAASMPVGADDGGAELNVELSLRNGYSSVGAAGDMHAHPETGQYSFLKPLLFWINPLIAIAQKGSITEDDIWTTPADCDVDLNAESLRQAYKIAHDCSGVDSPGGGLQWPWGQRVQSSFKDKLPAFGWSILIAFRRCIYVSGIYHVCFAALQLTLPYLIGELLAYIATGEGGPGRGFSLVAALGATSAASSYCIIGTFYEMRRGALQVKAATMMNVYRQSLQLTTASRQKCSVGQTTNLMSIDAEKLALALQFIHFLWHGPVAVVVVMIILSFQVGAIASFLGLSFLFALMPLQRYIAKRIGDFRRLMVGNTDKRVMLTNEILQVIRAIKYYRWEKSMYARIQAVRELEMDKLFTYLVVNGLLREIMFLSVPLAAFFIFVVYVYGQGRSMTVIQVFRVIAYLNTLRFPSNLFSQALKYISDGSVSVHRLDDFFSLSTRTVAMETAADDFNGQLLGYHHTRLDIRREKKLSGASVNLCHANFTWSEKGAAPEGISVTNIYNPISNAIPVVHADASREFDFELRDVCLQLFDGDLVAVIGAVGAGKSSLVSAMLGEMACRGGSCVLTGTVAYCAQTPWIQNMTLRDNVLFGQGFHSNSARNARYFDALYNAALLPDLLILPRGDLTEIGGQKARVSLARALMAAPRSDVILLDDPFSAVDGHTGESMFFNGVVDALKGKLRVVVMNSHMHLIHSFDKVVMMQDGRVVAVGSPSQLAMSEHAALFAKMTGDMRTHPESKLEAKDENLKQIVTATPDDVASRNNMRKAALLAFHCNSAGESEMNKKGTEPQGNLTGQLIVKEERAKGDIAQSVYITYFSACLWKVNSSIDGLGGPSREMLNRTSFAVGLTLCTLLVFLFATAQAARISVDLLLVRWAQDQNQNNFLIYLLVLLALCVLILIRMFSLNHQAVRSSENMHSYVLQKVMNAPIPTFFDTHTVGEVLNRFAKDLEVVDSSIPEFFLQFMTNWFQIGAIFLLCVWSTPLFLAFIAPLAYAFYKVYVNFACVQRDLKRLESVCRTPVYSSFSETLNGLDTIRAYGDSQRFIENHLRRMNRLQKVSFHSQMVMTWVTARLELMVASVMFAIALCAVAVRDSVSEVGVGMALVYTLQLTAMFQRSVQLTIDLQGYFTSAERLLAYEAIPQESSLRPGHVADLKLQNQAWPDKGTIEFSNVSMRYRENDLVLRGLSFTIRGGSRVGVCGRTGAGKSSIMVALFRIVNIEAGCILIDGIDTGSVPLATLRSRLAIIPQDPVLFSGTIRFQLDPFDEYSDVEVWEALEQVYMADSVRGMPGGLNASIAENGDNLSQGQRQLLCISRALLRKNRILIMDEATSAVDPHTDMCIQKLLQSSIFSSGCTVLTIAHRLQTIVDYDYVLVMDNGRSVEYGPPQQLLQDEHSLFYCMYHSKILEGAPDSMSAEK